MEYRTCTYIHDDGGICNSAAVTDRNLCLYHLRHRARLMRMAQYRARGERFDLQLPPLESMFAVQSALTQLSEALAADMIELKRADRLIRVLNIASRNLLKSDKWPASPYHSDQPAPASQPRRIRPPQRPRPQHSARSRLFPLLLHRKLTTGHRQLTTLLPCPPSTTASTAPAVPNTPSAPTTPRRPNSPNSASVRATQGMDEPWMRYKQQQRNRHRRPSSPARKRYAAIALERNMRLAAERLAERNSPRRSLPHKTPQVRPIPLEDSRPQHH